MQIDYRINSGAFAHVLKATSATETPPNVEEENISETNSQITLQSYVPSRQHGTPLNLPLTCQTDKRHFHPANGFPFKCTTEEAKSTTDAPLTCYDLGRLYRVSVRGRQLSLKLVTAQPPTRQVNGLFICLKAMHYGPEQSRAIALVGSISLEHMKKIMQFQQKLRAHCKAFL